MAEKTQPGTYVFLGFSICALLLCTMAMITMTAVQQLRGHFDLFAEQTEAAFYVHRAARSFDAMQMAEMQRREANSKEFAAQITEHSQNAVEALKEAEKRFHDARNIELVHGLQKDIEDFARLHRDAATGDENLKEIFDKLEIHISEKFHETITGTEEVQAMLAEEHAAIVRIMIHLIIICSAVSIALCLCTGFFVSRKLQPKRNDIDPYAPPPENSNRDLSVVADKLQEVVDLLRR